MATQLEIEYALMAGAAYISTRQKEFNRLPVPTGWAVLPDLNANNQSTGFYVSDPSTGFEAIAFRKGTDIVISYAGTTPNNLLDPDNAANWDLAIGVARTGTVGATVKNKWGQTLLKRT